LYVTATARLASEGDIRWQLAHHEREAFDDMGSSFINWHWRDPFTGDRIAPAFSEQPKLPELSRWMPTEPERSWEDVAAGPGIEQRRLDLLRQSMADSVMVYQFVE
jgi:hypothetical protein